MPECVSVWMIVVACLIN